MGEHTQAELREALTHLSGTLARIDDDAERAKLYVKADELLDLLALT